MARQAPTIKASRTNLPEPTREGLRRYLSKLNGTPAAVLNDDSFMDLMIPILRADFELLRTYHRNNHTQLDVPIQIIGASQDEIIDFQSLLP
ncbi:MAG: thioesterase domain-containing protein, partial [Pseudomonadota bacterium]